jgi:DNA repair protein SbcD/Mre11
MTSFRFIHTADIHLDSPLKRLADYDGPAVECIRTATRQAFDNLMSEAIDQKVDFVVIAGDLYDGDWRDYQTGLFFVRQMGRLAKANIPAFVLYGNHDAESQITRRLTMPEGVDVFSARKPETFTLKELGVALHGQSFRQRDVTDNLAVTYPEPVNGVFNIGVLHAGMGGMGGHANYAPCTVDDLVAKGYDYWALGNVHHGVVLHQNPHVVFPGNLQGRHIRETGPKGAYLVWVADREIVESGPLNTDVVRWAHLQIGIDGCDRNAEALERVRKAVEHAIDAGADGRLLACRIELTGRTEIHDHLLKSRTKSVHLSCPTISGWLPVSGRSLRLWPRRRCPAVSNQHAPHCRGRRSRIRDGFSRTIDASGSNSSQLSSGNSDSDSVRGRAAPASITSIDRRHASSCVSLISPR